jgi:predicted transcriptional regulator
MKYRNRIEIIGQILETANGGYATKTKIVYSTFLNYSQLKEYLTILTEGGLLSYDSLTQTFKTTEKGLRFLYTYNQVNHMIKAEI